MVKRVFISYKYPEGVRYRNKLIKKLDENSFNYLGEDDKSIDISHMNNAGVGSILSDKIYSTHVTVVLISPNILDSDWIPWEVHYSIKEMNRANRNSSRNGIVAVVIPDEDNEYDYILERGSDGDVINTSELPNIISSNMFNATTESRHESKDTEFGSYISIYRWDEFCSNYKDIINTAYNKSVNMTHLFDITTQI